MKKTILIMTLFVISSCSPKNPYYKNHLSDLPYNVFFEAKQEHPKYRVYGEADSSNILKYSLPDTLRGDITSGDCVAEVKLKNETNQISDVSIIGMTLFDKKANTIIGFDRYAATNKRVSAKIDSRFNKYVQFAENEIQKLKFVSADTVKHDARMAYLKLVFRAD